MRAKGTRVVGVEMGSENLRSGDEQPRETMKGRRGEARKLGVQEAK